MNTRAAGITFYFAGVLLIGAISMGFRGNVSDSAPVGLWYEHFTEPDELTRGMTVYVCPPDVGVVNRMVALGVLWQGGCPDTNSAPLLKPIAAVPGDTVRIQHGMPALINGMQVPNTVAKRNIPAWPDGEYNVQQGEVWVFSSHSKDSFDSRYFGPVAHLNVRGEATPLAVVGNVEEM